MTLVTKQGQFQGKTNIVEILYIWCRKKHRLISLVESSAQPSNELLCFKRTGKHIVQELRT